MWLPSGGTLVIDRTEAMTVIDVNTGKFTGSGGNLEETVTRNNLEAAEEIVRQLRLRDIGGIIVIDFIDMVLEANRDLVLRRLTECLARDRTRHQVAEVTSLGLVQMTRKRVGGGLLEHFSTPCEHCRGRGVIVTTEPAAESNGRDGGGDRDGATATATGPATGEPPSRGRGRRDEPNGDRSGAARAVPDLSTPADGPTAAPDEPDVAAPDRWRGEPGRRRAGAGRAGTRGLGRGAGDRRRACATTSRRSSSSRRSRPSATGTRRRTAGRRRTPGSCRQPSRRRRTARRSSPSTPACGRAHRPSPWRRRRRGRVTRTGGRTGGDDGRARPPSRSVTVPAVRPADERPSAPGAVEAGREARPTDRPAEPERRGRRRRDGAAPGRPARGRPPRGRAGRGARRRGPPAAAPQRRAGRPGLTLAKAVPYPGDLRRAPC